MSSRCSVCTIDYAQQYALNTLALPFTLIALVAATWRINKKRLQQSSRRNLLAKANVNEADDERANLLSDLYFGFFLCCESDSLSHAGGHNNRMLMRRCCERMSQTQR